VEPTFLGGGLYLKLGKLAKLPVNHVMFYGLFQFHRKYIPFYLTLFRYTTVIDALQKAELRK